MIQDKIPPPLFLDGVIDASRRLIKELSCRHPEIDMLASALIGVFLLAGYCIDNL